MTLGICSREMAALDTVACVVEESFVVTSQGYGCKCDVNKRVCNGVCDSLLFDDDVQGNVKIQDVES